MGARVIGALAPGGTFAGYRIEALVGRGGMGVVYRATDPSLERPVALKLITPELAQDARFRARFLRESRLAAALDHPNVVPIYEAGEREGQLYLAMRYVSGTDLKTTLERDGRLTPQRALPILEQIAGALDAAHRRGLVHRDVKPANMLVDEDGHAYLTDFGVTKQVGGASTDAGTVVGTLDYLAPEQIRGDPVDGRADCYALGCVLYECLAGNPPFRRATEGQTLWAHMQEGPPPLSSEPALDPVLGRALAKEPDERYGSCIELIRAARRPAQEAARDLPQGRRRTSLLPRPALEPPGWLARRSVTLAIVLLVGGAALAAGLILIVGERSSPTDLRVPANAVARIDSGTNRITGATPVGSGPTRIDAGAGGVWVANFDDRTLSRLDPASGEEVRTISTEGAPTGLAVGAGAIWVAHEFDETLSRVDPGQNEVTANIALGNGVTDVAAGAGAVWVVNGLDGTVGRIEPGTNNVVETFEIGGNPESLAVGAGAVWVASGRTILRLNPASGAVTTIALRSDATQVAVGGAAVWISNGPSDSVTKVDVETGTASRAIAVGDDPTGIAVGAGGVWVANRLDGTVSRIDPSTSALVETIEIGSAVEDVTVDRDTVWVTAPSD
jgi:streptogramin lyase